MTQGMYVARYVLLGSPGGAGSFVFKSTTYGVSTQRRWSPRQWNFATQMVGWEAPDQTSAIRRGRGGPVGLHPKRIELLHEQ